MGWHLANFIISFSTLIALIVYAWYTYKIAKENYIPLIYMTIKEGDESNLQFYIQNHSKVEIEYFGKIIAKTTEGVFEFNTGFYGDEYPLIVSPFMGRTGHFELKDLVNEQRKTLREFVESGKIDRLQFVLHLKYRKYGKGEWKKYPLYPWVYEFKTRLLWLDDVVI